MLPEAGEKPPPTNVACPPGTGGPQATDGARRYAGTRPLRAQPTPQASRRRRRSDGLSPAVRRDPAASRAADATGVPAKETCGYASLAKTGTFSTETSTAVPGTRAPT